MSTLPRLLDRRQIAGYEQAVVRVAITEIEWVDDEPRRVS